MSQNYNVNLLGLIAILFRAIFICPASHQGPVARSMGAIHSTKIQTGPTGKRGPPQKVDPFFRNFSGWTEPIH